MVRVVFASFVCALLTFGCGIFRFIDGLILSKEQGILEDLERLRSYETIQAILLLNLIDPFSLGVVLSAFIFTLSKCYNSRKVRLIVAAVPCIIASVTYTLKVWDGNFDNGLTGGFGIRLLNALTIGAAAVLLPVYVGEISGRKYRGFSCVSMALLSQLGVTIALTVFVETHAGIEALTWFVVSGCGFLIFYTILSLFVQKSPYYLAMIGQEEQARTSMVCLTERIEKDDRNTKVLRDTVETEMYNGRPCRLFADSACRKAFGIMVLLAVCSELTGAHRTHFVEYYVYEDVSIIISGVKLLGTLIVVLLIDKVGRRLLIGLSAGLSVLCLAGWAALDVMRKPTSDFALYSVITVALYTFCMSLGLHTVPLVLVSELFPASERLIASGLYVIMKQVFYFAMTIVYFSQVESRHNYIVFIVHAVILIVSSVFVMYLLPETKQKSFTEIRKSLCKLEECETVCPEPENQQSVSQESIDVEPVTQEPENVEPETEQSSASALSVETETKTETEQSATPGTSVAKGVRFEVID